VHRVAQLVSHLTARVAPDEEALARRILPGPAWGLFDGMPVADRRHGLDVAQRLLAAGVDDRDVLAAALVHDGAKGRRLRLWHRVGGVLLEAVSPRLLGRLASADPAAAGYPWHLYLHHGELSARLAREAGLSERTVAFIAGRAIAADAPLAAALRRADDAS
jgi:hypothetical protein